jgi:hypothetical protein
MKKLILISTITVAFLAGCAGTSPSMSSDGIGNVNQAIENAQMKYNEAHKQQVAWQHTKSLVEKAKKAAKEAIAYANKAAYEADTAMVQAAAYEKTWRAQVPK